jgi:hypothetical protein
MDQDEILAAIAKAQADIDMSEHGATYAPVHPTVFLAMFNAAFEGYFGVTPEEAAAQSAAARAPQTVTNSGGSLADQVGQQKVEPALSKMDKLAAMDPSP